MCELNLVVIGMGLTVALLKRIISKCLSDDSVEFFREFS